jgi:hypothetical protein
MSLYLRIMENKFLTIIHLRHVYSSNDANEPYSQFACESPDSKNGTQRERESISLFVFFTFSSLPPGMGTSSQKNDLKIF